jgi:hypothetical protein
VCPSIFEGYGAASAGRRLTLILTLSVSPILILIVQAWLEPRVYLEYDHSTVHHEDVSASWDAIAEPDNDARLMPASNSQDVRDRARRLAQALEAVGDEGMDAMVGTTGSSAMCFR